MHLVGFITRTQDEPVVMYATYVGKMKANMYILMLSSSGWDREVWQHLAKSVIKFRNPK